MIKSSKYKFFLFFITFLYTFPSYSNDLVKINNNFLIFLEKGFLDNKIKTKNYLNKKKFLILDLNNVEYRVSFKLLKKNVNQNWILIPTLKITNNENNTSYSSARSLTFERNANLIEIETIANMLVISSINQMKKNGIHFNVSDQQFKDKTEKKLKVSLNYFNSCENNNIIEIMEKEFPGFIHLETVGLNTSSKTQINYFTTATSYKIKKWLELTMYDFNFNSKDFFVKIYKSKIDLNKTNKLKYIYVCE